MFCVDSLRSARPSTLHITHAPTLWSSSSAASHDLASLTAAIFASTGAIAAVPRCSIPAASMQAP